MTTSQLIYSVKEIFTEYLKDSFEYYNIPEYQRGYKWNNQQIEQLLNDINSFKSNGNDDRFYCVQNITIVEKDGKRFYNVVDGQQRLTTLTVLLSYLGENEIVKNKLKYSVRPDTDNFIKKYIVEKKISDYIVGNNSINENWDGFLESKKKEEPDYDHQDIYYLFSAYNTIKNWFEKDQDNGKGKVDKDDFKNKLLKNVKLIVNKPNTDNEQDLFMNLNTGKVSLDGADLVRALLITNVAKEELENSDLDDIKSIVRINERRVRIGLELDEISAWWNQANVREYFNFLNKVKVPNGETIEFDSEKYPIDLLYKLYLLQKKGEKEIRLQNFENLKYIELYKNLIFLHRTIKDWYQDCEIYHLVKYIVTQQNSEFSSVWELWETSKIRKDFISQLKEKIKKSIEENIDDISRLEENWFENENSILYKVLIITDIIQIIESKKSENKLPYLPAEYFRPKKEDIEHIFPQTPIGENNKYEETDIASYIALLNERIDDYNKNASEKIDKIDKQDDWESQIDELKKNINKVSDLLVHRNSIGNLVLLNEKVNRGYGNDFYTKKRFAIIQNTKKGKFIRPHTLNAFDKGYAEVPNDLDKWNENDIKTNAEYIKKQITDFFNIKTENSNEKE